MYRTRYIIFLAQKGGKQICYSCPGILQGYWVAYREKFAGDQTIDTLAEWTQTVPPVLRRKIQVHKGNFMNFSDLAGTKLEAAILIELSGYSPTDNGFNPNDWVRRGVISYQSAL